MLPVLTSDAIAGSGEPVIAQPDRLLLIVDDEPSVRHALWITFRETYAVALADCGAKALEVFGGRKADVVLLDIRMPGMNGLDVLGRLKEVDPDVEVILLSAYESIDYIRQAMRLGASDYLTKPYELPTLRSAVSTAMDRREVTRKTAAYDKHLAQLQNEVHHQQIREELARTRNEIYASIIHDINGPLTVISGYTEMISNAVRGAEVLQGQQLKMAQTGAENISRQVTNCIELSRRYLSFLEGKATAGTTAGIREIFYDVAELLKSHPHAKANELEMHAVEGDVAAVINRTDLLQVLLNLTINALQCSQQRHRVEVYAKYLPADAPRPFQQSAAGTRLVRAQTFEPKAPLVAISVRDNGPGIAETLLDRIFEPYFTTKPAGQGSGLGLSIVQRLVLHAHGAVHLYSHAGEGTVFTVYLPAQMQS
jgi:signal transduction histidine kinase